MNITPEQKKALDASISTLGTGILDKVSAELSKTTTKVTAFVETESAARVNADNEILSQIENVKAVNEGKANGYVYFGDENEIDGRNVLEILKDNSKTNFNDMAYVLKNVGEKERTVRATVAGEEKDFVIGNQDALVVSFDKKGNVVAATLDNNTFDTKLQNVQAQIEQNYASNTDLEDFATVLSASVNSAIAKVAAYSFS